MTYIPWKDVPFGTTDDDWKVQLVKMGLSIVPCDIMAETISHCHIAVLNLTGLFINKEDFEDKHLILISERLKEDPNSFVKILVHEVGHFFMGHSNQDIHNTERCEAEAERISDYWLKSYAEFYKSLSDEEKEGHVNVR